MKVTTTNLPGVLILEPKVFQDPRGYFLETYSTERYNACGITLPFVQDNLSRSEAGTLRGMHYQLRHPQGKLVHVMRGKVLDVILDIRVGSPTFGQWLSLELSEDNHRQVYIPPGLAHGFYTLSEEAYFYYKCTDYYHPEDECGIAWNDSEIGIKWPLVKEPLLSPKDRNFSLLSKIPHHLLPIYSA